jgi:hypothetical protein
VHLVEGSVEDIACARGGEFYAALVSVSRARSPDHISIARAQCRERRGARVPVEHVSSRLFPDLTPLSQSEIDLLVELGILRRRRARVHGAR